MTFLRPLAQLRPAATTALLRPAARTTTAVHQQVRLATQDYGSGAGDPAGENPQAQGKRGREDLEHPGPPPPKVAQKKDNNASSSSSKSSSSSSPSSSSSASKAKGVEKDGGSQGSKGAQPKILNENPPTGDKQSEDVKRHNRDMDRRAEKAHEQVRNEDAKKDKVGGGFWSGQGGRDREP